jgi:deoxyadenosine/deoxycytidine kinase
MASSVAFTRLPQSSVSRFTLEGLIGAGKSRFLAALKANFKGSRATSREQRELTIVDEPVERWCSTKDDDGKSVLSYFYDNKERYGFLFQINALMTRYGSTLEANDKIQATTLSNDGSHVLLSERTIGTDCNVFARMLHADGTMNSMEYLIYKQTFDTLTERRPECNSVDGVIFVHTTPEESMQRILKRGREGENIPLDYLEKCAAAHEQWLPHCEAPVLVINGNVDINSSPQLYASLVARTLAFMDHCGDVRDSVGWKAYLTSEWSEALELASSEGFAVFARNSLPEHPGTVAASLDAFSAPADPIPKYLPPLEDETPTSLCELRTREVVEGIHRGKRRSTAAGGHGRYSVGVSAEHLAE